MKILNQMEDQFFSELSALFSRKVRPLMNSVKVYLQKGLMALYHLLIFEVEFKIIDLKMIAWSQTNSIACREICFHMLMWNISPTLHMITPEAIPDNQNCGIPENSWIYPSKVNNKHP